MAQVIHPSTSHSEFDKDGTGVELSSESLLMEPTTEHIITEICSEDKCSELFGKKRSNLGENAENKKNKLKLDRGLSELGPPVAKKKYNFLINFNN